eukprot:12160414-Karenia_brevis.AAC.1
MRWFLGADVDAAGGDQWRRDAEDRTLVAAAALTGNTRQLQHALSSSSSGSSGSGLLALVW